MVHHFTQSAVGAVATCRTHFTGGSVRPEAGLVSVSDELQQSFLTAQHYENNPRNDQHMLGRSNISKLMDSKISSDCGCLVPRGVSSWRVQRR